MQRLRGGRGRSPDPGQRLPALRPGPVVADVELAQGHTLLKLDLVLGHRWRSVGGLADQCAPGAGSDGEPPS